MIDQKNRLEVFFDGKPYNIKVKVGNFQQFLVGDTGMRKISIGEVLYALCEEIPITKKNNQPITKAKFKNAMLASELFSSRTSINIRWDQLYNKIDILETRGVVKATQMQYIVLDTDAVERAIINAGLPLPFDWNVDIHTHTHTQEASQ